MAGDPRYDVSQTLPAFDYAAFARSLGLRGIRVETPDAVRPAWEEALAHAGPVVIDAVTDPNMPPLPPQLRFETLKNMTRAFLKGDPAARDIMRHAARARASEITTRK
jgi:pyruvate dehydrogenase (quinone)